MREGKREKCLNTPSATSKPAFTGLILRIDVTMEPMDVKDDTTKMSTMVGTDPLALAKSKLGSQIG